MPSPCVRIAQVSPGFASLVRSSVPVGEIACRKPCGCSSASVLAVKPASARRAAMMPACAALPAWNGLVMVPKFDIRPELCEAPSAIACAALSASSRRSDGAGRGRADRAVQAGRMPALLVQQAGIAAEQLGPGFVAGDIGDDHVGAGGAERFGLGQDRRHQHGAGMAAQSHVVVVERMRRGAVDPGGFRRRALFRCRRSASPGRRRAPAPAS